MRIARTSIPVSLNLIQDNADINLIVKKNEMKKERAFSIRQLKTLELEVVLKAEHNSNGLSSEDSSPAVTESDKKKISHRLTEFPYKHPVEVGWI